jgi:hypothetical protein
LFAAKTFASGLKWRKWHREESRRLRPGSAAPGRPMSPQPDRGSDFTTGTPDGRSARWPRDGADDWKCRTDRYHRAIKSVPPLARFAIASGQSDSRNRQGWPR